MRGKLRFTALILILTGAFAVSGADATLTVAKTADGSDGVCAADCSLREAVTTAQVGDSIVFASSLFDTAQTVQVNGQVTIDKSLFINGRGANLTTIQNIAAAKTARAALTRAVLARLSGLVCV